MYEGIVQRSDARSLQNDFHFGDDYKDAPTVLYQDAVEKFRLHHPIMRVYLYPPRFNTRLPTPIRAMITLAFG